jgi:hypothetical protein
MLTLISFVIGLIVGWNFLPQPQFVKDNVDKVIAKFKGN